MNKKLHFLFGSAIVVVLLVVGLWSFGLASNTPSTADQDTEVTVIISTEEEEIISETVTIASDISLMELMQQHYDIIVTEEGFIEAIEGVEQDPEKGLFWIYEVNEDRVNESAEDFIPEEDDRITWQLIAF